MDWYGSIYERLIEVHNEENHYPKRQSRYLNLINRLNTNIYE